MLKKIKNHKEDNIFLLILVAFVFYKIPHLNIPLFWDEMGVYGKSIFYLLDHKIGFLPNYLEPELSRGHPMLYVFFTASFSHFFGKDVFSMHLFNLVVSILTLFSFYYINTKLFSKKIALFSIVIIIVQPLFLAQSIMVLPEMMLVLFMLWSIYYFLNENWLGYFIATSLALFTKETAVFMPLVFSFVFIFWNLMVYRKISFKKNLFIFLPFISFFLFLQIQKIQNGWYFFPYHNPFEGDKGFFDIALIIEKFKNFLHFVFLEQGRKFIFVVSIFIFIFLFFSWNKKKQFQLIVFIAVIIGLILFSATNHFMKRYMILNLFLISSLFSVSLAQLFQNRFWLQFLAVIILSVFSLKYVRSKSFQYDENMAYLEFVDYQKELTHFLENQKDWNNEISITSNFPIKLSFEDKRYGFSDKEIKITINSKIKSNSNYIIETNPGSWRNFQEPKNYSILKFPSKGFCSVKIYRKND